MLPTFIVIGARKSATTSLHLYLSLHPQVTVSDRSGISFLNLGRNWNKGSSWYAAQFEDGAEAAGDVSPGYTNHPFYPGVPERMHAVVPEAGLIYIVRDPIERIISHYRDDYATGYENRTFEEALADLENNAYVCYSQYFMQLQQYLPYFPQTNLLIVRQEDLLHHRTRTMQRIFGFVGVDPAFDSPEFEIRRHRTQSKRRTNPVGTALKRIPGVRGRLEKVITRPFSRETEPPVLTETMRQRLIGVLGEDVASLRKLTGESFSEWSI